MLKAVLNQLVADDVLVKNHAATVKLPPIDAEVLPENLITLEEGKAVIAAAKDDRISTMILIAMQCGLRPAEIAGLRVRDIDTEGSILSVMQQISRKRVATSVLKTKASRRTVPMPLSLVAEVKPFMEGKGLDELLFQTANGNPYSSKDLGDWLHRVERRTTLSRTYTWRDFRHFYASSLIRHGINVKTVQRRMGHASAKVTLDIYTHIWPDQDDKTREAIEIVWFDAEKSTV
ncbi:tyrosine-type recombinase/integrase [Nocardia beijingensis]